MKIMINLLNILCLLAGLHGLDAAYAGNLRQAGKEDLTADKTEIYYWYDGDQKRTIWLNPKLQVDFPTAETVKTNTQSLLSYTEANPTFSNAHEITRDQAGARLLRFERSDTAARSRSEENGSSIRNSVSPVFHQKPNNGSMKRALPGNVIVYFKPGWTPTRIDTWISDKGFEIVKKLPFQHRKVYIIKTAPGLEALSVANELYESGDVEMAFPNWWTEVSAR